jgi:hypothetical protein
VRPKVKLIGEDGNVFFLIGRVCKALKKAGLSEKAKEFQTKALTSKSYDEVLSLISDYVTITGDDDEKGETRGGLGEEE